MNDTINEPVVEEQEVVKEDLLNPREAMAKAIEEHGDKKPEAAEVVIEPTQKEVKAAVDADPEPPAEFSAKGKDAWKRKDIRGIQEEYKRVNADARREMTRAQQAEREALAKAKPAEDILNNVRNYLTMRGDDGTVTEAQIVEALKLVNEFKKNKDKPSVLKAELKAIGVDLDAADANPTQNNLPNDEITSLRNDLNTLLDEKRLQEYSQKVNVFGNAFNQLGTLKNRTGDFVFPDLQDGSEEGKQLAQRIGSRTQQPEFQQMVARRFPDADFSVLVREAYIWEGGKVSGEPVQVSTEKNQKHIEKSRRAAASTPGRVLSKPSSDSLIGKLSNKAALKKAIEIETEH